MRDAERLSVKVFLFIIVTGFMNFYVLSKLFRLFEIERGTVFYVILIVCTTSYLLGAELLRVFSNNFVKGLSVIFSTWLGVSFNFLWTFGIYDLINLIIPLPFEILGFVIVFAVFVLTFYSIYNATTFSIRTIKVESEKLKKSLKIVQLSDLHVGATHRKDFLDKIIEIVNEINPNFVVLTGDLLDGVHHYKGDEFNCLRKINCPVFFVLGNHEQFLDMDKVYSLLEKTNMTFLRNRSIVHEGIQIIGIDDTANKNVFLKNFKRIVVDNNKFTLLLYHRPNVFNEVAKEDVDLMLSGHTHAGQLFPLNVLMAIIDGPVEGIHKKNDSILYISNGTGWWGPPMRLGSRNEITIIELVSKSNEIERSLMPDSNKNESELEKIMFEPSVINEAVVVSLKRGYKSLKKNKVASSANNEHNKKNTSRKRKSRNSSKKAIKK
jgi:uncharacterized protein